MRANSGRVGVAVVFVAVVALWVAIGVAIKARLSVAAADRSSAIESVATGDCF